MPTRNKEQIEPTRNSIPVMRILQKNVKKTLHSIKPIRLKMVSKVLIKTRFLTTMTLKVMMYLT